MIAGQFWLFRAVLRAGGGPHLCPRWFIQAGRCKARLGLANFVAKPLQIEITSDQDGVGKFAGCFRRCRAVAPHGDLLQDLTLGKRSDRSPSRYRRNESIGLLFDHCELTRAFSVLIDQNRAPGSMCWRAFFAPTAIARCPREELHRLGGTATKNDGLKQRTPELLPLRHRSMSSRQLDESLVNPAAAVVAAPHLPENKTACDWSARHDHGPQVPGLGPCGFRTQAHHLQTTAFRRHLRLSLHGPSERGSQVRPSFIFQVAKLPCAAASARQTGSQDRFSPRAASRSETSIRSAHSKKSSDGPLVIRDRTADWPENRTRPFAVWRSRFACREAIDNPRRRRRNETWLLRLMTLLPVNSGTCDPLADLHDRFAAGFSGTNRKARGCRCGVTDQR